MPRAKCRHAFAFGLNKYLLMIADLLEISIQLAIRRGARSKPEPRMRRQPMDWRGVMIAPVHGSLQVPYDPAAPRS
jgi:hypothetical protein